MLEKIERVGLITLFCLISPFIATLFLLHGVAKVVELPLVLFNYLSRLHIEAWGKGEEEKSTDQGS